MSPLPAVRARPCRQAESKKPAKAASTGSKGKKVSGFMKFSKEKREQVKEDNPGITFGQIGKKLGEMWRELDSDAKAKYSN